MLTKAYKMIGWKSNVNVNQLYMISTYTNRCKGLMTISLQPHPKTIALFKNKFGTISGFDDFSCERGHVT